jgi:hypothetical protein
MYGCNVLAGPHKLKERIFPLMFSRIEENFSYDECNFIIQKTKESTARVVMSRNLVQNSYTLECSFCGPTNGKYQDCQFNPPILKKMGHKFCLNMLQFQENTRLVKECYSLVLESFDSEQALMDAKLEEEKRPSNSNKKTKGGKEIQKFTSIADNSASSGTNSSKKGKTKGKNLKKSSSTNDKKRSHSAELKQIKPAKKKILIHNNNSKPSKTKKKK